MHLLRHGQTASYDFDAGLTDIGRTQAGDRGRKIAATCLDGDRVGFRYASTARARETVELVRVALLAEAARHGVTLVDEGIDVDDGFRNVQVWSDDGPSEPTQVRQRVTELATGPGVPPGWVIEATRFWRAHEIDDAMNFWLATPLLWHEPPASVVDRVIGTSLRYVAAGTSGHLVVGTHSGCLRAVVAWASGADPGEPRNGAEVVMRVEQDSDIVAVGYSGQEWRARVPVEPLDWSIGVPSTEAVRLQET